MDEDAAGHIRANDCSYALDVHDFNFAEWQRNMRKRRFKCEDVMEYIVETFNWKRSLQAKYQPGDIFQVQDDVTPTMRYDCVNWLVTVTRKMDFALETFCLAVNFLDRFLCLQPIQGNCLQLVGLVAFFVASKQEEVDPPEVSELVTLCGGAFPPDQIQNMEKIMLARLNFQLVAPTSGFFLQLIVEIDDDLDWPVDLARHLVEMALEDPVLAQLRPLRIANGVRQIIKVSICECKTRGWHQASEPNECANCNRKYRQGLTETAEAGKELKRCADCHVITYCDKDCQAEHWAKVHKKHCKFLSGKKAVEGTKHVENSCSLCVQEKETKGRDIASCNSPKTNCHVERVIKYGNYVRRNVQVS